MKPSKIPNDPYLNAVAKRTLVYDGGMGAMIQREELTEADFGGPGLEGANDYLNVANPKVIAKIQRAFLEAGADVVETNTFGSTRLKLDEYGKGDEVEAVNRAAAEIARAEADALSTPEKPRFVAGSLGPTGFLPSASDPDLSNISLEKLEEVFCEQSEILLKAGVDLLLIETAQDMLEVKQAIFGARRAMAQTGITKPLQVQPTLDATGHMLLGTDIDSALITLEALGADVIGLNCSTGPDEMVESVRRLANFAQVPVSVIPNAGMPENVDGQAVYPMEPGPMARQLARFVSEWGIEIVGGCCGSTPEHIRAIAEAVAEVQRPARDPQKRVSVSGAISACALDQDPRPLLIGERINAQGSRKAKRLMMEEDYEALVQLGREQAERGAHVLDICCALTERSDEADIAAEIVKRLSQSVSVPLMIDTTEPEVAAAALARIPGRAILNSINLETPERVHKMMPLAQRHGAAVLALTIDEEGMAKTAQRKLEAAEKILRIVVDEYGFDPSAVIFDPLTFTLATGQEEFLDSANETLKGIRLIKEKLPECRTSLGLSNVSFGLKPGARRILNSAFFKHAVEAGMDMAIVNAAEIIPYPEMDEEPRGLAEDLIFNRHPDALAKYIEYFESNTEAGKLSEGSRRPEGMTPQQEVHYNILNRTGDGTEAFIDACLKSMDPVEVLNGVLLPAMKEVGDKFGAGELILPFVLQSAEVMKRAVAYLEGFMEKSEGAGRGQVVLATVFGDVHDIGKNLVKTILSNNGYTVHDLGKQVPLDVILKKAEETKCDAVALSALLVSTSKQMAYAVQEMHDRKLGYPILVGGAAINRPYARRISFPVEETYYEPGLFYCKDAFEGLETMNALLGGDESREAIKTRTRIDAIEGRQRDARATSTANADTPRSEIKPVLPPAPPFWGVRTLEAIPLREVFTCLNEAELYRSNWGVRGKKAEYDRLIAEEFGPMLERMKQEAMTSGMLQPKAVYGIFPVAAVEKNALAIYDPNDLAKEIQRFVFPRQGKGQRFCLADYFLPADSNEKDAGERDAGVFCAVTVGDRYSAEVEKLNEAGKYAEALYLHGLAVQTAEALAEWLHRKVRKDWGLPLDRGQRYSPGYPAWPELEDQQKLYALLDPPSTIGVGLTEAHQMDPEASTSNLIVHHPEASYWGIN